MSSESNREAIAALYRSFEKGEPQPMLSVFDDDSLWSEPAGNVRAGVFRGAEAIAEHTRSCRAQTDGTWGTDVQEILGGEKYVVVVERALALRNGTSLNMLCNTIYEMADGKVAEMRVLPFDPEAWHEFWS